LDRAEPLVKEAHEIRIREYGQDHPVAATSLHSLGLLALLQGRLDEAADQYVGPALAIRRRRLGERTPGAAETMFLLAWLHDERCEYKEAEDLLRQVISIRRQDPSHRRELAIAHLALAGVWIDQGRYREASAEMIRVAPVLLSDVPGSKGI